MYMTFTKVQVSFIGAYVAGGHIRLNLTLLISQVESDGALTLIYIAMDILDGRDATTQLYIDMRIVSLAEVWAIGYNPTVINDHSLSPISRVWYGHWGANTSLPAVHKIAIMS